MLWTDIDHSFCEEHLLGLPEYYNSISSLFIIYFGISGLMNLHNDLKFKQNASSSNSLYRNDS